MSHFLPYFIPYVNQPVLTAWNDELGIGSKRAFNDRWFINEIIESEFWLTFVRVHQNDSVVRGSY